jgi:hypothetical protein
MPRYYSYPNRSMCSILEDVRSCIKTLNFSYLTGLVEELQWAGNRMEASLSDQRDIFEMKEERSQLKKELEELRKQKKDLGGKSE